MLLFVHFSFINQNFLLYTITFSTMLFTFLDFLDFFFRSFSIFFACVHHNQAHN